MALTNNITTRASGPVAIFLALLVGIVAVNMQLGCEGPPPQPFVPKASVAPEVVYCNDHTGHKPGNKPWIMGGKCTCTPSGSLMQQLHADGFCEEMTANDLRVMYEEKGIKLRQEGHMWCNGLCRAGKHVVLGGNCMCPPTPGTDYYERIITGAGVVPPGKEISANK